MYWCNLGGAQSKVFQFYQTRSNAIIFYNTLLVHRKGGDQEARRRIVQQNVSISFLPQRIVLKPNLHYGRQDTASFDARTSFDHSGKHRETCGGGRYRETCRSEIDFRIQGLPHSTVQQQDHTRKEAVQKLFHQFETHPNREALKADLTQNHEFNPLSEQSKEMIYSMGNMEYLLRAMLDHSQKYSATTV